jgi:hypothetical protein
MNFVSASPSIVRSVLQRSLLNTWQRAYDRCDGLPAFHQFEFDRLEDERPDMIWFDIVTDEQRPRFRIAHQGNRLAVVYGFMAKGEDLEKLLRPHHVAVVMPVYYECLSRCRPIYSVYALPNVDGRRVLYERLLLPFGSGGEPNFMLSSVKAISDSGAFVQKNLMLPDATVVHEIQAVIDSGLAMSRIEKQLDSEVIEL